MAAVKKKKQMSIKGLIDIFAKHEIEGEKMNQKLLRQFKENNPGVKPPKWFTDGFNVSSALKLMCEEIQSIKGNWE